MTVTKPRGKLKQARLGVIQKKVLVVLIGLQYQQQQLTEPFSGLSYSEVQARLYNQAVLDRGQWLQSVYAQHMYSQGQISESNRCLLDGIELVVSLAQKEVQEEQPLASFDLQIIRTNILETLGRIQTTASLLRQRHAEEDQESIHFTVVSLARDAALYAPLARWSTYRSNGFLTLTEDEQATAEKIVTVQQASLSRAVKLLEEHGLIVQREMDFGHFTERRFYATPLGVQRLNSKGRRTAEKG